MASLRNIVKYTALTEFGLFGGLLAVAGTKGFVQAIWNGHSFMDSLLQGALLPVWLPCMILCVHLVFVVTFPAIVRLLTTMAVIPFLLYFIIFVTFPTCGHVSPPSFTSLPEYQQEVILLQEAEERYAQFLSNPNSDDASTVRYWQGYNEKPYTVYIAELKAKVEASSNK